MEVAIIYLLIGVCLAVYFYFKEGRQFHWLLLVWVVAWLSLVLIAFNYYVRDRIRKWQSKDRF